jgi:hypothetical protein
MWEVSTARGGAQQPTALKAPYAFSFAYFSFLPKRKVGGFLLSQE